MKKLRLGVKDILGVILLNVIVVLGVVLINARLGQIKSADESAPYTNVNQTINK